MADRQLIQHIHILLLGVLLLTFALSGTAVAEPLTVKVGVYENKPLVYLDTDGTYQGLAIDVLRYIAQQENWQLDFIPGSWTECLQRLENADIDLQAAIAVSEERKKKFSYPEQTLITNWGRLYKQPGSEIDSLLDLEGKKVALVEKDIHAQVFLNLMEKFSIKVIPVYVQEYFSVLENIQNGNADAGAVNRLYALQNAGGYQVETTPMIFNPIEVRYATPLRKNAHLRQAIDWHLLQLRQDKNSIYYQSLEKWFAQQQVANIPLWVKTILPVAGALLLGIFGISLLLKRQVRRKTTELNQANQQLTDQLDQLHRSEQKYRTLLESTSEGFWQIDAELKTVAVNASLCKMLQITAEDMIGSSPFAFLDEENQQIMRRETARIATTQHRNYEIILKRKDGSALPAIINATTLYAEDGSIQGSFAFVTDITEHKKSDQLLSESETKFRTLLNNQNDAIFLHKFLHHGFSNFVEVNAVAIERYGYSREEFSRLGPPDITAPDEARTHGNAEARQRLHELGHLVFETIHRKKTGELFPVEISSSIVEIDGEEYILATVRDITERKSIELEQRRSYDRFITVLNSIDAGVYVADMDSYEILFMNQFLIDSFGKDFTGRICHEAFRAYPSACDHCNNELLVDKHGQPTDMQVWQGQNPITGRHYMNYDRAIHWIDGRVVRLQISTDITEIKTLEMQLRQKYKMEAVGLMAGGIAHDFNNVLSIIMTNLELMERKMSRDDPQLTRLQQAKTASLRASDLVKQILTYSRKGEQDLKPVQLAYIVEEGLKLLRSTTPASIEILTRIEESTKTEMVRADSIQIEEVLINLCTNAVHAIGEKGLLAISLEKTPLKKDSLPDQEGVVAGDYLKLEVSDSGTGMTQEVIDKIFDPFFTTKPAGQGTGMGLSISHGIIKKHHGYFVVNSEPGKGSRFSIYLPIVTCATARPPVKIVDDLPGGSETILLIDDEEMLARSVAEFLIEHGYSVTIETDSRKALERLTTGEEKYDLVITDQTMPELTGFELAETLLRQNPQQAIILCTGYSAALTEEKALAAGVKAFFMKPLDLASLTQSVRAVLDEVG